MQVNRALQKKCYRTLPMLLALMLLFSNMAFASGTEEQALAVSTEIAAKWEFKNMKNDPGVFYAASGLYKDSSTLVQEVGGNSRKGFTFEESEKSIRYQGWDNGKDKKAWVATLSTKGLEHITLSSQQKSSSTGPRDFKVQISTDLANWKDVTNGALVLGTDYKAAGSLSDAALPSDANDQERLYIRWVVSSNARVSGSGSIGDTGSSRIKDVIVKGMQKTNASQKAPQLLNMTFNGNPKTSTAFAWYTPKDITGTKLQVVAASEVVNGIFPEAKAVTYTGSSTIIETFMVKSDRASKKKTKFASHKVIANNLKPGTAYKYRAGNGDADGWSPIGSFATDQAGNEGFHFIVGSDSQASSKSTFELWQDTFRRAIDHIGDPKFFILTGDLVDNGDLESQWQWFLGIPQNEFAHVPFVPVLGGHEVKDYDGDETTENNNFYNHFNLPKDVVQGTHDGSVYAFEYGDALFMQFNSQFEGGLNKKGELEWADPEFNAQLDWMRSQVAKTDKKWKFVSLHKGPYSAGDNAGQWEDGRIQFYKKYLVPVFDEMGIDMVFEAHDHMYMRSYQMLNDKPIKNVVKDKDGHVVDPKGTVYLMTNSVGGKFYEKYPGYDDYFAAINAQPFKKMFTDVSISKDILKFTSYTAAKGEGLKKYDEYSIKRTDDKPAKVEQVKIKVESGKAVISWNAPSGTSEPVRGFRIYEQDDKVGKNWSLYIPAVAGQTEYKYTLKNVDSSKSYHFVLKAAGVRNNSEPVHVSNAAMGPAHIDTPAEIPHAQ
ncbi:fibronectin type III domain-containing protein [Paenibacillus apiarius]|uniref:Metallophosphoesterase n=1 Tax=Paenibacillus apiarius TaxID=46240 RepID=A0ABT4DU98_9BACL|nr:fibronectin type III domain-containing protein [Paenibacillus apiarius]MCY9515994.1 metallophosphoesterase [Paenibacillus apiarius]MCY9520904.1 metallophosphoesterase [Paenibacillus apiarius]MCY9553609.1 metallophosphoesterase [Paenibacillus apiarius]MCY9557868.1 metallophosphoesterase [Paenibacillus apiarius]MCY9685723.1 metallophosphoesterase [Paenibacillus apiarius]